MAESPLGAFAARLGRQPDDEPRALANIYDALVEARALARQPAWEWETVPDRVVAIILHAAIRLYQNPEGYLTRQAGAFSTTKAPGTVPAGIFNGTEESVIKRHRPRNNNGLWVLETTRGECDEATYLDPVEDIQGAKSKPFPIDESDPDWVPSLKRGIPQGDSPLRSGKGWF